MKGLLLLTELKHRYQK